MPTFAEYQPERHGVPDPGAVVRRAVLADLTAIQRIVASRGPVPEGYPARVGTRITDPGWTVLVAVGGDGGVLGWAMAGPWSGYQDAPDGRYVSALTVEPIARRRGLGDRLLAGLLAADPARPVFSVINARNRPSLDLHRRHGFDEVARAASFAGIAFGGGTGVLLRTGEDLT